jgi:glycosyltransferase involved in cell wall biosynthesis
MATRVLPKYHSADARATQDIRHQFARQDADVLIAISEQTKRDIVAYLGIEPARIHVVPGGVGPEFARSAELSAVRASLAPFGLEPDSYVLHVGTIEARKNLPRLVEAYAQARRFLRSPIPRLVLAGERGYRAAEVDESINQHGVSDHVSMLGRVRQEFMPALYAGAIALVYPSLYEGFGLPPLEAMASGTPVIASKADAIREVVGEAGVLVDPRDVGELGRAIRSVAGDPEKRSRLSADGLVRASRFTWESAARRLRDVYRTAR